MEWAGFGFGLNLMSRKKLDSCSEFFIFFGLNTETEVFIPLSQPFIKLFFAW